MAGNDISEEELEKQAAQIFGDAHKQIIHDIVSTTTYISTKEMFRAINEKGVYSFLKGGLFPYAASALVLALSGKEIESGSIKRVVKALDIKPEDNLLKELETLNYKNHIVYINALYLLLAMGRDPTEESITKVATAIGAVADKGRAKFVMELYNQKIKDEF